MKTDFYIDSAKLKIAAARACLSFRRLAQKADLSPETVTRLYRNRHGVTTETAGKLAKALGVDVLDIVKERGEKNE
ncbi:helix-turn-helix domain-containing protein [uncultured Megasphaera sp.]|uniref:helix-turn-helix domain-containing protein n=1 Tax=uncultured Megasphaera sp. TaxID=165188 RepID=UPI00260729F1|nr:helix-turn-helix domain-containing protein [uncultured Megasphaera sp.]